MQADSAPSSSNVNARGKVRMEWFYIEALVALVIGLGIVWWTTRALRAGKAEDDDGPAA